MKLATIQELAHLLKEAKVENLPQPIVFLGAGASKTGGIPLPREIVKDILEKHKNDPRINSLRDDSKTYAGLMECLSPFERNRLLKGYIDKAKVNVTHIYLAQLLIEGFVDYVLTVNFDNLMLRALALFNHFPATYDMAILRDQTTTCFQPKSVVYLHGQHHGLWLLNTVDEMARVQKRIPSVLHSIRSQRPWVFIGYSGEDPILDHIINLGRFDNGLYWVTYYNDNPNELVCDGLLERPDTNAFLIKGYDADSFMLQLSAELELPQPTIIDQPLLSLENTLKSIVDIDDREHFRGVKERLEIAKNNVGLAIKRFEKGEIDSSEKSKEEAEISLFKKRIIAEIIGGYFDPKEIRLLENNAKLLANEGIDRLLSDLLTNWANRFYYASAIAEVAGWEVDDFESSLEKYKRATELNPRNDSAFHNWGNLIAKLAKLRSDETLYELSFEKYEKAAELNPSKDAIFNNWANAISYLAKFKNDEDLYALSFQKYKAATELNPKYDAAFNNWGSAIAELAKLRNDQTLYKLSVEKFERATKLNPKRSSAFTNWGNALAELAELTSNAALYELSREKHKQAAEINALYQSERIAAGRSLVEIEGVVTD